MGDFGEECIYGKFECPRGASCFPNGSGIDGTCRCESFFGFQGANCDELSAASWLLFALTSASMVLFFYTLWVNVVLLWQLRRVGLLQQDSVGRTVLFGSLLPCPLLGLDIGIMLTLFGVDKNRLYDLHLRVPLIVATQFLFVAATLSVSTVWLEMANKAKAGRTAVAPQPAPSRNSSSSSSSRGADSSSCECAVMKKLSRVQKGAAAWLRTKPKRRNSNSSSGRCSGYDPYRATLYGTAWGTSVATLIFLIALADPLLGSIVLLVVMALVGASFLIAGNRIYRTLLRRPVVAPAPAVLAPSLPPIATAPPPSLPPEPSSSLPPTLAPPPLADLPSSSQLPTAFQLVVPPTSSSSSSSSPASSLPMDHLRHDRGGSNDNHSVSSESTTSSGRNSSDGHPNSGGRNSSKAATNDVAAKDAPAQLPTASESPLEPSVYAMALHVQRTARGVGARCVTVAVLGLLYGLSRPSPTPLYQEQNSLPPLLSGQVPYFFFTVAVMNTSTYIASYLRFWKTRRENAIARTRERKRLRQVQQQRLLANQGGCNGGGHSSRGRSGGSGFAGVDPRAPSSPSGGGSGGDLSTSGDSTSYDIQLSTIHECSDAREKHSSSSSSEQSSLERIEQGVTRVAPSFVPPISFSSVTTIATAPAGSSPLQMPRGITIAAATELEMRRNLELTETVLE